MVGLVERKLSKSALWCRRLAYFAVPYFLLTILMHRYGNITADQAIGLLSFGFLILVLSILLAINAMVHLWNEGVKGGKMMITGLFLSSLMMAPFVLFAVLAIQYPAINDVATNVYSPPAFSNKTISIRKSNGVPKENDVSVPYRDDVITQILVQYPKISPRRYPAGPERVYKAVRSIVEKRGWQVLDIRGLDEGDKNKDDEVKPNEKKTKAQPAQNSGNNRQAGSLSAVDNGLEATHVPDIYIDAVSLSLFFAFKNDVVIKIVAENENTLVEMRSAARWGVHDFGVNARIIKTFLSDLDQSLLGIAGEG